MKIETTAPPPPATISAEQLATLAGLTKRRLYQLAEEKRIPPADNGRFPMLETIRRLFDFFQREGEQLTREKLLRARADRKLAERRDRLAQHEEDLTWLSVQDHEKVLAALVGRIEQLPANLQSRYGAAVQIADLQRALDQLREEAAGAVLAMAEPAEK